MTTVHLRDLVIKHNGDKKYVLDRILNENLTVEDKFFIKDWPEPFIPAYAPPSYLEIINRLNGQIFEHEGNSCKTENRIESSGRIYTSLIFDEGPAINYQNLREHQRRLITSNCSKLELFDISASHLRIALSLRGIIIPFDDSPWDDLVTEIKHTELNSIDPAAKRRFIKRVAIMAIKKIKNIDIKKIWKEEIETPPKENLKGIKKEIDNTLFKIYPEINTPSPRITSTPDDYLIRHEKSKYLLPVKCRPLKIDTKYYIPTYEDPTENNIIEAIEGWLLRELIRCLPHDAALLTCHDEILTNPQYISSAKSQWELSLNLLAATYK